jgi:hypothetical protein
MQMTESMPTKQIFNLGEGYSGCGWGHGSGWGCGGGGDLFTILLLFCLFGGGGFGGGFNSLGRGALAADTVANTAEATAEIKAGINYLGQSQAAQTSLLNNLATGQAVNAANITATINSGLSGLNSNLQNGFYGINNAIQNSRFDTVTAINNCCCTTNQNIAMLGAALDKATCAIVNSGKDNTQAILTALCNHWQDVAEGKICDLQRQLSEANIIAALKN